ncbi:uncharacterized protein N7515_000787 [Penicillium bovifimosum]|uniref:Uncharacterized protein n=1 Tax=Penicillium bovifimosum TaxID=126998 RepID=A0A9W9HG72_9EURO|nr:uncharacterized protein N7515_000787 [Penicillium bovifimosum]KAJ5146223.1 hypothetical protein N7515_000787 [Penicillium bovifimosum]
MGKASLTFPAMCLALSFLFVIAVYHASIIQRLSSFHRRIILPLYRRMTNITWANHVPANHDEARYELISRDINDDEEESEEPTHPALPRTPRSQPRSPLSKPARPRTPYPHPPASPIPANRPSTADESPIAVFWTREPHLSELQASFTRTEDSDGDESQNEDSDGEYPYSEYSIDSSDDENYIHQSWDLRILDPHIPGGEIPVWQVEAESQIYTVDDRQPRGVQLLLDQTVEWTVQMVYGLVAPHTEGLEVHA